MKDIFKKKLALVIFGSLVVIFFLFRPTGKAPQNNQAIPAPTTAPFGLINTFPAPGEQEITLQEIAIQFYFNKPINRSSVDITLTPFVNFELATLEEGSVLVVRPIDRWEYETEYTIKLSLLSLDGQALTAPIKHSFKFKAPSDSPLAE